MGDNNKRRSLTFIVYLSILFISPALSALDCNSKLFCGNSVVMYRCACTPSIPNYTMSCDSQNWPIKRDFISVTANVNTESCVLSGIAVTVSYTLPKACIAEALPYTSATAYLTRIDIESDFPTTGNGQDLGQAPNVNTGNATVVKTYPLAPTGPLLRDSPTVFVADANEQLDTTKYKYALEIEVRQDSILTGRQRYILPACEQTYCPECPEGQFPVYNPEKPGGCDCVCPVESDKGVIGTCRGPFEDDPTTSDTCDCRCKPYSGSYNPSDPNYFCEPGKVADLYTADRCDCKCPDNGGDRYAKYPSGECPKGMNDKTSTENSCDCECYENSELGDNLGPGNKPGAVGQCNYFDHEPPVSQADDQCECKCKAGTDKAANYPNCPEGMVTDTSNSYYDCNCICPEGSDMAGQNPKYSSSCPGGKIPNTATTNQCDCICPPSSELGDSIPGCNDPSRVVNTDTKDDLCDCKCPTGTDRGDAENDECPYGQNPYPNEWSCDCQCPPGTDKSYSPTGECPEGYVDNTDTQDTCDCKPYIPGGCQPGTDKGDGGPECPWCQEPNPEDECDCLCKPYDYMNAWPPGAACADPDGAETPICPPGMGPALPVPYSSEEPAGPDPNPCDCECPPTADKSLQSQENGYKWDCKDKINKEDCPASEDNVCDCQCKDITEKGNQRVCCPGQCFSWPEEVTCITAIPPECTFCDGIDKEDDPRTPPETNGCDCWCQAGTDKGREDPEKRERCPKGQGDFSETDEQKCDCNCRPGTDMGDAYPGLPRPEQHCPPGKPDEIIEQPPDGPQTDCNCECVVEKHCYDWFGPGYVPDPSDDRCACDWCPDLTEEDIQACYDSGGYINEYCDCVPPCPPPPAGDPCPVQIGDMGPPRYCPIWGHPPPENCCDDYDDGGGSNPQPSCPPNNGCKLYWDGCACVAPPDDGSWPPKCKECQSWNSTTCRCEQIHCGGKYCRCTAYYHGCEQPGDRPCPNKCDTRNSDCQCVGPEKKCLRPKEGPCDPMNDPDGCMEDDPCMEWKEEDKEGNPICACVPKDVTCKNCQVLDRDCKCQDPNPPLTKCQECKDNAIVDKPDCCDPAQECTACQDKYGDGCCKAKEKPCCDPAQECTGCLVSDPDTIGCCKAKDPMPTCDGPCDNGVNEDCSGCNKLDPCPDPSGSPTDTGSPGGSGASAAAMQSAEAFSTLNGFEMVGSVLALGTTPDVIGDVDGKPLPEPVTLDVKFRRLTYRPAPRPPYFVKAKESFLKRIFSSEPSVAKVIDIPVADEKLENPQLYRRVSEKKWIPLPGTYNGVTLTVAVYHYGFYQVFSPISGLPFAFGDVYVYPNPSKDGDIPTLHVEVGQADKAMVRVYDISGDLVYESRIDENHVVVNGKPSYEHALPPAKFKSGVYNGVVTAEKGGKETIRKKFKFSVVK